MPTTLQEQRPQAKKGDKQRYLLFTGHGKDGEDKQPGGTPCIHEIQGKEQQGRGEGDCMKIKDDGILLRGVEQVEESNSDSGPLVTQAQAGQPEGREGSTCHD